MVQAASFLIFNNRMVAGGLGVMALGSLGAAWRVKNIRQKESFLASEVRKCCERVKDLYVESKSSTKGGSSDYLLNAHYQETIKYRFNEVDKILKPHSSDARIQEMRDRLAEGIKLLDGSFQIIGDKGLSWEEIEQVGLKYVNLSKTHPEMISEKASAHEKQWAKVSLPNRMKRLDEMPNQKVDDVKYCFEIWIREFQQGPGMGGEGYSFRHYLMDRLSTFKVLQGPSDSVKELPYAQSMKSCADSLYQIWEMLSYNKPIVLKGSPLFDPVFKALDPAVFKAPSSAWLKALGLGACVSGIGALGFFLKS